MSRKPHSPAASLAPVGKLSPEDLQRVMDELARMARAETNKPMRHVFADGVRVAVQQLPERGEMKLWVKRADAYPTPLQMKTLRALTHASPNYTTSAPYMDGGFATLCVTWHLNGNEQ